MSGGNVVDLGTPQRIYEEPASRFVAEFMGLANILPVTGVTAGPDGASGSSPLGPITFRRAEHIQDGTVTLLVRLEDVELRSATAEPADNTWSGRVVSALFLGSTWDCIIDVNGFRLRCAVPRAVQVRAGDQVTVHIRPENCVPLPETGADGKPVTAPQTATV